MNLLLDTHTLLWYIDQSGNLPDKVLEAIQSADNKCIVSIVSFWEIATKIAIGKLETGPLKDLYFRLHVEGIKIQELSFYILKCTRDCHFIIGILSTECLSHKR